MISTEDLRKLEDADIENEHDSVNEQNVDNESECDSVTENLYTTLDSKYHKSLIKIEDTVSNIKHIICNVATLSSGEEFMDSFKQILSTFFKLEIMISSIHSSCDNIEECVENFNREYDILMSIQLPNLEIQNPDTKTETRRQLSDVTSRYIHLKKDYELLLSRIESQKPHETDKLEYKKLSAEFKAVIQDSEVKKSQISDLKLHNDQLISQNEDLESEKAMLLSEIATLKSNNGKHLIKDNTLSIEYQKISQELKQKTEYINQQSQILQSRDERIKLLERYIENHNSEKINSETEKQIQDLNAKIQGLYSELIKEKQINEELTTIIDRHSQSTNQDSNLTTVVLPGESSNNELSRDSEILILNDTIETLTKKLERLTLLLGISLKI